MKVKDFNELTSYTPLLPGPMMDIETQEEDEIEEKEEKKKERQTNKLTKSEELTVKQGNPDGKQ